MIRMVIVSPTPTGGTVQATKLSLFDGSIVPLTLNSTLLDPSSTRDRVAAKIPSIPATHVFTPFTDISNAIILQAPFQKWSSRAVLSGYQGISSKYIAMRLDKSLKTTSIPIKYFEG